MKSISYIAIFHTTRHGWCQHLQSLPYHSSGFRGMSLQQTMEHLEKGKTKISLCALFTAYRSRYRH